MTEHQEINSNRKSPSPDTTRSQPIRKLSRRRLVLGIVAAAIVIGGMGAGVWVASTRALGIEAHGVKPPQIATDTTRRGDLEGNTTASGTLRYKGSRGIQSGLSGTVTALPSSGASLSPGDRLYTIDDSPVFLLRGDTPAWRSFASGMNDGSDVKQLEQALSELGFFTGEPDEHFSWATAKATMDWQKSNGISRTGELPFGSIVFTPGDLRIGSVTANVGDLVSAGAKLFMASGTTQIVDVNLSLSDQQLAVLDAAVVVRLPGGKKTTGKIVSVGTPTEIEGDTGGKQTVIPTVITLNDPAASSALQEATVTVDIPSELRKNVLSVPVGALLAITPNQFGIEVVDKDDTTRQVPVRTGLFAGGRVEISGSDVTEGLRVVVPKR
ncbi:efflux RND transporter periplasmic adaptor subunit [Lacisediminihabitans sp. FW035]